MDGEVAEEIAVGAVAAVFGLLLGRPERARDQIQIEIQEERSVEQKAAALSALSHTKQTKWSRSAGYARRHHAP